MRDPLSKLICMGCLKETPVNGVIDGKKYRKRCPVCREQKNHVARPHDFKVAGFSPKTKLEEKNKIQQEIAEIAEGNALGINPSASSATSCSNPSFPT